MPAPLETFPQEPKGMQRIGGHAAAGLKSQWTMSGVWRVTDMVVFEAH